MPGAVSSNQTQSRIPAAVGMRAELPGPLAEGVVMELALLCAVCAGREGWGRGKACQPEKHRPEKHHLPAPRLCPA